MRDRVLDEELSFLTPLGDTVRVRIAGPGEPRLTHELRVRGREAARAIRIGLQWKVASILRVAQLMHSALRGADSVSGPRILDAIETQVFLEQLVGEIEQAFETGRLVVVEGAVPLLGIPSELELVVRERPALTEPPLPPIARGVTPERLTLFDVRFVDEIGKAISGLEVELRAGTLFEKLTTNPAGVALLEDVASMAASVGVVSIPALEQIVDPRWQAPRS